MSEILSKDELANAKHVQAAGSELYVVDYRERLSRLTGGEISKMALEGTKYSTGITSTDFKAVAEDSGDQTKLVYRGDIYYEKGVVASQDMYFNYLQEVAQEEGFGVEGLFYNNARLINDKNSGIYAGVSIFQDINKIEYRSQYRGSGAVRPVRVYVDVPLLSEIGTNGRDQQLSGHIKGYLIALNALARIVGYKKAFSIGVSRSTGTQYGKTETEFPTTEEDRPEAEVEKPKDSHALDELTKGENVGITLDDIAGYEDIKRNMNLVIQSFNHPEVMEKWGAERPQAVLLYGPPGTGKTSFAQAVANGIGGELREQHASDIYKRYIGQSEEAIDKAFDEVEKLTKPTVWLWDEFEGIINSPTKSGNDSDTRINVMSSFKKRVARLREVNPNIILIATTNNIDMIDKAILRAGRFDIQCYVDLPGEGTRAEIFVNKVGNEIMLHGNAEFRLFADDIDFQELSRATNGMSGADIVEVIRRAKFEKAIAEANGVMGNEGVSPLITQSDLMRHIRAIRVR